MHPRVKRLAVGSVRGPSTPYYTPPVEESFDYPLLVREALRGVVARVLTRVEREGLPGAHHLYLSFDTQAPGVVIPPGLRHRYPEEMTIILQHQFWGLRVDAEVFEVTLRFGGHPEKLRVPLAALTAFADPSVPFGFRLDAQAEEADEAEAESAAEADATPVEAAVESSATAKVVDLGAFRRDRRD
jgi:hypothetical protein